MRTRQPEWPCARRPVSVFHAGQVLALASSVALGKIGPALIPVHGFASLVCGPTRGVCLAARCSSVAIASGPAWRLALGDRLGAPSLVASLTVGEARSGRPGRDVSRSGAFRDFHISLDRLVDVPTGLAVNSRGSRAARSGDRGHAQPRALGFTTPLLAQTWLVWWTGDLMGVLIVAPWCSLDRGPRRAIQPRDLIEAAALGR
jgi:hypothetical protein